MQYPKDKAQIDSSYRTMFQKTSNVHMGCRLDDWEINPVLAPKKVDKLCTAPMPWVGLTVLS